MSLKRFQKNVEAALFPKEGSRPSGAREARLNLNIGRKDTVKVSNFADLKLPRAVRVKNFEELQACFTDLAKVIRETFKIEIPEPRVTVHVPDQKQPNIKVDPKVEVDLSPLLKAVRDLGKKKSDPDAKAMVKLLREVKKTLEKGRNVTVTSSSSGMDQGEFESSFERVSYPRTNGSSRATCANAGTAQAFGPAACKYAIITAEDDNTDTVCIGAAPVAAAGSMAGIPLEPGRSVRLEISNMSQLKIDSRVNGEGVTYEYFN